MKKTEIRCTSNCLFKTDGVCDLTDNSDYAGSLLSFIKCKQLVDGGRSYGTIKLSDRKSETATVR